MMYTGRRLTGEEAKAIGLLDQLVPTEQVREAAVALATEIAQSAPLAIVSTRETLRRGLAAAVQAATEREYQEQNWLRETEDFREGVRAMAERRLPDSRGRDAMAQARRQGCDCDRCLAGDRSGDRRTVRLGRRARGVRGADPA